MPHEDVGELFRKQWLCAGLAIHLHLSQRLIISALSSDLFPLLTLTLVKLNTASVYIGTTVTKVLISLSEITLNIVIRVTVS